MLTRLLTPPVVEPVTIAEVMDHCRIDTGLDITTLGRLITAARRYVELVCWRGLVTQAYQTVMPGFLGQEFEMPRQVVHQAHRDWQGWWGPQGLHRSYDHFIKLPRGQLAPLADLLAISPPLSPVPTSPVISVKYVDPTGVEQTLDPAQYSVDAFSVPGRLRLAPNCSWPSTMAQWDAVKVVYWVGWAVADVPAEIKQAILLLVSQLYEHRTPEVIARAIVQIQFTFDALVDPYRLNEVGG